MTTCKTLVWFRQDLRLDDNPALAFAAEQGEILPVYILDTENPHDWAMGEASQVWLHHSLEALNRALDHQLVCLAGDPQPLLASLIAEHNITHVVWNRCYEPWRIDRDTRIKAALEASVECRSFNGSLLWEPWTVAKNDGTPYKVFTPFYRKGCLSHGEPALPKPAPNDLHFLTNNTTNSVDDLALLPDKPWHGSMMQHWQAGEQGAFDKLNLFLNDRLSHYKIGRDFPAQAFVSNLSPHLHFGEISPHRVWHAARQAGAVSAEENNLDHFLSELGWREFSYYLLYHFPTLPEANYQPKFDNFPWQYDENLLRAWQHGRTGFPIVDAGMRQLWQTGTMHNRVRMIVASFLVKNALIHWHHGQRWFWDCLVDADLASNSASWQWVAGSGADAAPYFRIFNPLTQSEKFDPEGHYLDQFVPELQKLPIKYKHAPWTAPSSVLQAAGITLDVDYPAPILDLKSTRVRALNAYQTLKEAS